MLKGVCKNALVVLAPQVVKQVDELFDQFAMSDRDLERPWGKVAAHLLVCPSINTGDLPTEDVMFYTKLQLRMTQLKAFQYSWRLGKATPGQFSRAERLGLADVLFIGGLFPGSGIHTFGPSWNWNSSKVSSKSDIEQFAEHDDPDTLVYWIEKILYPFSEFVQ